MRFPTMFSPIQIGSVTVPNRFVVPPMANNFSDPDGCLSQRSLAYYAARARGGFGLITIESAVVYEQAKGGPRKACLFADHTIDSFRRVAEACHSYGAKVSVQLQHAGPEGSSALTGHPLKAASPVPAACGREIPWEMPRDEVYRLIECYADAARRAGSNPCPPMVLGVGIGGDFELCALLAKKALCRPLSAAHPDPYYAELEREALERVNALGIGPQGFGGATTALGVAIETHPTHIAGLPVAVNVGCHVTRHCSAVL